MWSTIIIANYFRGWVTEFILIACLGSVFDSICCIEKDQMNVTILMQLYHAVHGVVALHLTFHIFMKKKKRKSWRSPKNYRIYLVDSTFFHSYVHVLLLVIKNLTKSQRLKIEIEKGTDTLYQWHNHHYISKCLILSHFSGHVWINYYWRNEVAIELNISAYNVNYN